MAGLTQNYITPFALALKATSVQIGLLSSIPNLATAFSQLAAPGLVEKTGSRKSMILPAVLAHAVLWLLVFSLPFFFRGISVWLLIGLITGSTVADALVNPAWGSMMADLVHEDIRGRYFSFRRRIMTFTTLVFSLIAGSLLQILTNNVFSGFAIIFAGAMVCRSSSLYFLSRMYEPPMTRRRSDDGGLLRMVANLPRSNIGRFSIFIGLINCAVMISGPFFSVYMLRDLKLDYLTYTLISVSSTIATVIALPYWGRRADRAGNLRIIKLTAWMLPAVPLLWLASVNPWYLMAANMFSGIAWSGFDLASSNFVYDASDQANRTRQLAVFNCVATVAASIGAAASGYIAPRLPELLGYQLRTLFVVSGALRAVVVLLALRHVTEVRHVSGVGTFRLLMGRRNRNRRNPSNL
jgi:MFS family permease